MAEYYVAPTGLNTNPGSLEAPWDLDHALTGAGGVIVAGDTMWLRGGLYSRAATWEHTCGGSLGAGVDNPTTKLKWRNFPGELVSITTTAFGIEVIRIDGSFNWWWATVGKAEGIEFWRNTPVRDDIRGTNIWFGLTPQSGNKLIHVITRDGSNGVLNGGFNPDYDYGDLELYGVLAYNNGEESPVFTTHGFYFRHQGVGTKAKVSKCILFNQVGYGLHHWSEHADGLRNIESTDNIIWGAGVLGSLTGDVIANILFAAANGVGAPIRGGLCSRNILLQLKQDARSSAQLIVGGLSGVETNEDMTCEDNYVVGGGWDQTFATIRLFKFLLVGSSLKFNRNEVIPLHDANILENTPAGALTYTQWLNNKWYRASALPGWRHGGTNKDFATWKANTGLGSSDTADLPKPTVNKVFVIKVDKYNPGYGHVCFFNWELAANVVVDLSTILSVGDAYEVYNAQDILGDPIITSTYNGGTVLFPTTGKTPPIPVGQTPRPPLATSPFFDAFLVRKVASAAPAPPATITGPSGSTITRLIGAVKQTVKGWIAGLVEEADAGTRPVGGTAQGLNLLPTPAGRMATRGGARVMVTLNDDAGSPVEITHVLGLAPFTAVGATAFGWSDGQDKHYAWHLTPDIVFQGAGESVARRPLGASWNKSTPGVPIAAELFEKLYVADAVTNYAARAALNSIDSSVPMTVAQPSFDLGGGSRVLKPYCCEEFNGVLFIAGYDGRDVIGADNEPAIVRHSFLGIAPDVAGGFDKDAWNIIGAKGERVYALRKGLGLLLIAKANEVWRLTGAGRALPGWQYVVEPVLNTHGLGVSSPRGLVFAEGKWYGIGKQGPFLSDGYKMIPMGKPRRTSWRDINLLENSWVSYHPERHLILFGLHPAQGTTWLTPGSTNNRSQTYPWVIWAWDIDREVWAPDWTIGPDATGFSIVAATPVTTDATQGPTNAPFSPNTTAITTTSYTAGWTNSDASAENEFWEKVGADGTWILKEVLTPGSVSFPATGRITHQDYYWKVRHRKGGVTSTFCAEQTVKTLIAEPGLAVECFGGFRHKLTITQNAPGTSIEVERSPIGAGTWTVIVTFAISGTHLSSNGDFDYRARARDAAWPAPDSPYTPVITLAFCPPE